MPDARLERTRRAYTEDAPASPALDEVLDAIFRPMHRTSRLVTDPTTGHTTREYEPLRFEDHWNVIDGGDH